MDKAKKETLAKSNGIENDCEMLVRLSQRLLYYDSSKAKEKKQLIWQLLAECEVTESDKMLQVDSSGYFLERLEQQMILYLDICWD